MTYERHGDTNTKLHRIWRSMRDRCNNAKNRHYHRYGGRGVKVCDDWNTNYLPFRQWAINNGYKEGLTIDRINNDGNYCPDNCRWVTRQEQAWNKSDQILFRGMKTKEAEGKFGVSRRNVYDRRHKGWDLERAFSTPVVKRPDKSLKDRCKEVGISYETVRARVRRGMTVDDALSAKVGTIPNRNPMIILGKTVDEWSKISNIDVSTIYKRIRGGMPPERAVTKPSRKPSLKKLTCRLRDA